MNSEHLHAAFQVRRVIDVENASTGDALNDVKRQLPGILELKLDKQTDKLTVAYDAARIAFSTILSQLAQAGIRPIDSRWFRLKAAWYDYTDRNAADQAHSRPRACCNKVPRA